MKIIGVTGMPGSGKGIVAGVARKLGFEVVRMGDVIREEAQKRNSSTGEAAIQLRKEYGEFIVAEKCILKVKEIGSVKGNNSKIVIEGIRSPYEVDIFKRNFKEFKVISVQSSPDTRFKRLLTRNRMDDFNVKSDFHKRDKRELKFGIGEVIATADYTVVNEGTKKRLINIIRSILTK